MKLLTELRRKLDGTPASYSEDPGFKIRPDTDYRDFFVCFTQSLQAKFFTTHQIGPFPLSSRSYPIYYSLIILEFGDI
jgi:hypothetical protein